MTHDYPARQDRPTGEAARGAAVTDRTGMLTDHYELTMVRAALASGAARRRTVFEMFTRQLPAGRRYGVVAGTGRFIDALERFTFAPADIDHLLERGVIDDRAAAFLGSYRFGGSIWGYDEGDCFFPGSPILVVEGTFAEAVLLETLALSIFNHDCAVASAASRMVTAAGNRSIIEMGSRRTHEVAAVAAARAAYVAGFAATSNLRAGQEYGVPTTGTSAHAFTMVHDDEWQAFGAQLAALGEGTTLLVDTYEIAEAVKTAVDLAGPGLGAVRIDSGDVAAAARSVRAQLDALGAPHARIVVTGDLDEHSIAELASAPIDGYGVGTALVTGSGVPTAALVYKLVARSSATGNTLQPVAKRSVGKPTIGGRKWAARELNEAGTASAEIVTATAPGERPSCRPLLRQLVRNGRVTGRELLEAARRRHADALRELPAEALLLDPGTAAIPTVIEPAAGNGQARRTAR